jgi:hypothetical protein
LTVTHSQALQERETMPRSTVYLAAVIVLALAAGCSETVSPEPAASGTGTALDQAREVESGQAESGQAGEDHGQAEGGPTIVARAAPQLTATSAANRLAAVPIEGIPGVLVPGGAELVEFAEAESDRDAHATYSMPDAEIDELRDWFETQLTGLGWGEPTLTDGSLVFKHLEQFSDRYQRQGLRRTATVHFFEVEDGIEIHVIVEAPAQAD